MPAEMNEDLKKTARAYFFGIIWPKEKLISAGKESLVKSCLSEVYKAVKLNMAFANTKRGRKCQNMSFFKSTLPIW